MSFVFNWWLSNVFLILRGNFNKWIIWSLFYQLLFILGYLWDFLCCLFIIGCHSSLKLPLKLRVSVEPSSQYSWGLIIIIFLCHFLVFLRGQFLNKNLLMLILFVVLKKSSFAVVFTWFLGILIFFFYLWNAFTICVRSYSWCPMVLFIKRVEGKLLGIWRFFYFHIVFKVDILHFKWRFIIKFTTTLWFIWLILFWGSSIFNRCSVLSLIFTPSRTIWTCPRVF